MTTVERLAHHAGVTRVLRGSGLLSLALLGLAACVEVLGDDFIIAPDDDEGAGGAGTGGAGPASTSTTAEGGGGGNPYVGTPCDPASQDCPAPLTCVVTAQAEGVCAAPGSVPEGGACNTTHPPDATSECIEGHICHQGRCRALCVPTAASPCPSEHACLTLSNSYSWCDPWCDPIAQSCQRGEGCYALPGDGQVDFVCAPAIDVPPGSPCSYVNECVPGATCIPNLPGCNGEACCASFCSLSQNDCAAPMMCSGFPEFPSNLGICWY